jgi:Kelch motif
MYTWVNGDVITSARLNALEGDRAPVTVQTIAGQPNGTIASYPISSSRMAAAVIGDYIYIFGGLNGSDVGQTAAYRYSVSANSYTAIASLPVAMPPSLSGTQFTAIAYGGDIYLWYNNSGVGAGYKYSVSGNSYSVLAAPGIIPSAVSTVGSYIYLKDSTTALLKRYDPALNTYSNMANIPVGADYYMGTDGTDLWLFGQAQSYLYSVSGNSYTAKAGINDPAGMSYWTWYSHNLLYTGSSASTRNKNRFWVPHYRSATFGSRLYEYSTTGNTWTLVTGYGQSFETMVGYAAGEAIYQFCYNSLSAPPWSIFTTASKYTTYLSPFTASSQGVAVSHTTGTMRNETTAVTGSVLAFKAGEVITNNASRGNVWGGTAVASFDAVVIQKG